MTARKRPAFVLSLWKFFWMNKSSAGNMITIMNKFLRPVLKIFIQIHVSLKKKRDSVL